MAAPTWKLCSIVILSLLSNRGEGRRPTQLVYEYPTIGTWLENAAVRSSGGIVLTSLNNPGGLHSLSTFRPSKPTLVTNSFDNLNSTLGIVETDPDTFFVVASNFSLDPATLGTQEGTNAIFKVIVCDDPAGSTVATSVTLLSYLREAQFLNGLTKFNNTFLFAADSAIGAVWGISTETGKATIVARDLLMAPPHASGFVEGINGVRIFGKTLYFTNSQRGLFAALELDQNGYQLGPATKIATPLVQQGVNPTWDDFAIDRTGEFAYVATQNGNTVQRINISNGEVDIIAGGLNNTAIAEPAAVVSGRTTRYDGTLYALTTGGLAYPVYTKDDGPKQFGAQIVAIDLRNGSMA